MPKSPGSPQEDEVKGLGPDQPPQPPDRLRPGYGDPGPATAGRPKPDTKADSDSMLCDRCGAQMFRMHAVWRCPACGFKTDCCGW